MRAYLPIRCAEGGRAPLTNGEPLRHRWGTGCAMLVSTNREIAAMAKGLDKQKEQKKKPAKTAKEKKAEKNEKKSTRGFAPT